MTCDRVGELLSAYADGELDLLTAVDVERHAATCGRCAARREELAGLRAAIASGAPRFSAPAELRRAVGGLARGKRDARGGMTRGLAMAAMFVVAASLTWIVVGRVRGGSAEDVLTRELVSAHVRSMLADHLVDVPSSDRHQVRPWFGGKLDYSPEVRELAADGFPLAGGRLDYAQGRAVAAIVYRHGGHVINCFVWPAGGGKVGDAEWEDPRGYRCARFSVEGQACYAVSDASWETLRGFVRGYRGGGMTR
jgi:anti-sigma factor RsiW